MGIAALIAWVVTALGGFVLLGTWISHGGARAPRTSHLPPAMLFGHFAVAAIGLIVWIVALIADQTALHWVAFVLLVPVAALGFVMLARWLPTYRARAAATPAGGPGAAIGDRTPAEQHFPVPVVMAHGLVAVVTVVLVLLASLSA
jgi:hypothetical protein